MLCWMNGSYMPADELRISPFDHGFLYGAGFFETFRTYGGHVFLFTEHMNRLKQALAEYRIVMPYEDKEILTVIRKLDEAAGGEDGYFRLNVSAGVHDIGLAPASYPKPNVIVFRKELPDIKPRTSKEGVWLKNPRSEPESSVRHKSHHFLNNIGGRMELPSLKEYEGLFLTKAGFVAEGVTSNVFWVKDGELFTPSIETGILPGTTRAFVMQVAKSIGIAVYEGFYSKEDAEAADELFVTNAVQEIVPLHSIAGVKLPGREGPFFRKLLAYYRKAIEERRF